MRNKLHLEILISILVKKSGHVGYKTNVSFAVIVLFKISLTFHGYHLIDIAVRKFVLQCGFKYLAFLFFHHIISFSYLFPSGTRFLVKRSFCHHFIVGLWLEL